MSDIEFPAVRENIAEFARRFGVLPAIHPADFIFQFLLGNPKLPTIRDSIQYYFEDGKKSSEQLLALIRKYKVRMPADVLEFAAGYGCVSRHLVSKPAINLWACDIHVEAVKFLQDRLYMSAFLSTHLPERLTLPRMYDIVFALSFFSHMPITTWEKWFRRLSAFTRLGGLFIFTTHGRKSVEHLGVVNTDDTGFWFRSQSEQKDLPSEEYGLTVTMPEFVDAAIRKLNTVRLLEWREGFWWGHQDLYVLRKVASWWPSHQDLNGDRHEH